MAVYCYFIANPHPELEALRYPSLHGAPLLFIRHEDLIAAVRRLPAGRRVTPERILDYNAVLSAASRYATVLPARFGAEFPDETALIQMLAGRGRELGEALSRLNGKVEMGLRVELKHGASPAEQSDALARICGALESRFEVRSTPAGHDVLEVAHLISREQAVDYRERAKPHVAEISGPRPPLHFLPPFLRKPVEAEHRRTRRTGAGRTG